MRRNRILFAIVALLCMTATAMAQDKIYLVKDSHVVAKFNSDEVDYLTYRLPEGVTESNVAVEVEETSKNSISYKVTTTSPSVNYVHAVMQESFVNYVLMEYFGSSLDTADELTLASAIKLALYSCGFEGRGTASYTVKDMDKADDNFYFEIIAGQPYYVVAWEVDDQFQLKDAYTYTKTTTQKADESPETLQVAYAGLNAKGEATFNFTLSDGIVKVYTMYGYKSVLQSFIQLYGYEYTIFLFGEYWFPEELAESTAGWIVENEDEYVLYALGVDGNGDWVKDEVSQTIKPMQTEQKGPAITINEKSKGDGKVSVSFSMEKGGITEAYVSLLDENTVDRKLNQGYNLAEIAANIDALDVANIINRDGTYTYTNESVEKGWKSLLISGRNSEGTTVVRINFNAYVESEWDIETVAVGNSSEKAPRLGVKRFAGWQQNRPVLGSGRQKMPLLRK